ncbi:KpsF/GutQ family sugar-phosphate isomerase [Cetobacterium sp. SF1]|uniref:KpsF/GutQ family sugar-phosphate isomerase n=1 Tax=unclassified Cetobacterium TaxID=2630983 RepID=UPI003CEA07C7
MNIVELAKEIFDIEINELEKVKEKISDSIGKAAQLILESSGKVVITGIGKSGIIGKKIAATLASTGTYAVFMNAAEGVHGDLGIISPKDVVLAISNSGNSDEVISLIPSIRKIGAKLIGMTGNENSRLGLAADVVLNIGVEREACPMNLAPTSSTTATLVMGDALSVILIKARDFKPENFALYHPGGSLGRRLLMKVKDVMHMNVPIVSEKDDMDTVILTMTNKRLGAVCVVENNHMVGLITEGDIRRALKKKEEFFNLHAKDIMTKKFISVDEKMMALEAMELMENRESQISVLPVLNGEKLVGLVRIHDLLNVVGK